MSKSNLEHELLQGQSITADEVSQMTSPVSLITRCDLDSVTPFAKDMVENVITGALGVLDISRKESKSWKDSLATNKSSCDSSSGMDLQSTGERSVAESVSQDNHTPPFSSADVQRTIVQVMQLRVRGDAMNCDSVHAEQVAKIVKGLQDIQIGDSAYVLPANGSNIEKQVKRAVRNISNLEFGDMEAAQLIVCDGQGDVDTAIIDAEVGPPSCAKPHHDTPEVPTRFLHKMIEELEEDDSTKAIAPDHRNKEGIATWEESEEQFIRTIEGLADDATDPVTMENQDFRSSVTVVEESSGITAESDTARRVLMDALRHAGGVCASEEIIADQEIGDLRSRDLLDNSTDEDPYWCTAGLISRVVTHRQGESFGSKVLPAAGQEPRTLALDLKSLPVTRTETSLQESASVAELDGKHSKGDKNSKGEKTNSFRRRVRKFFARFTRSKNC